jgi:hypothetical protein
MLSFSREEFLLVLENYNLAIWPIQIIAYALIALVLYYLFKQTKYSTKIILSVLSLFWLFNGIVFSLIYWSPSHFFGYTFGVLCVIQGLLLLYSIKGSDITIGSPDKTYTLVGLLFVFYAIIGYQLFGYFLGHIYPKFFPAVLVPCPTAIFTFGIFLIINNKIPLQYYIIPFIIALGGFLAAYNGIYEDVGLILTGVLGSILIIRKGSHVKIEETQST